MYRCLSKQQEKELTQKIGENLKRFRDELGLTQTQAAKLISVTFQQMQKYERGNNRLSLPKAYVLAMHYGVSLEDFIKCSKSFELSKQKESNIS